jgi:phage baseplate assembly protein W
MAKAFSIEDGNLGVKTITSARKQSYTDLDLTFSPKPAGDLYKKNEAAAVKQAVKTLLLTNVTERPFNSDFGGNLNDFIFELDTETDADALSYRIINMIDLYEPRAKVLETDIILRPDTNEVRVVVKFQVVSTSEEVVLNLSLTRLR